MVLNFNLSQKKVFYGGTFFVMVLNLFDVQFFPLFMVWDKDYGVECQNGTKFLL